jgi:hypothetical protein
MTRWTFAGVVAGGLAVVGTRPARADAPAASNGRRPCRVPHATRCCNGSRKVRQRVAGARRCARRRLSGPGDRTASPRLDHGARARADGRARGRMVAQPRPRGASCDAVAPRRPSPGADERPGRVPAVAGHRGAFGEMNPVRAGHRRFRMATAGVLGNPHDERDGSTGGPSADPDRLDRGLNSGGGR